MLPLDYFQGLYNILSSLIHCETVCKCDELLLERLPWFSAVNNRPFLHKDGSDSSHIARFAD